MYESLAEHLLALSKEGKLNIPMLPEVAQKAMQLARDPESDAPALAKLIQADQSLAAHVMRIANSAAYSPNGNIISLQQAISRLGMNLIAEITLTAALSVVQFKIKGFEHTLDHIWKHAVLSGLWAKEAARKARKNVEAAFVGGLLHTVGSPVVINELVKHKQTINEQQALAVCDLCATKIAEQIVSKWGMPQIVVDAISAEKPGEISDAVHLGSMLACEHLSDEPNWQKIEGCVFLDSLNLYKEDVVWLLEQREKVQAAYEAMQS